MAGTLGTLFVMPRYQGMYQGVFANGSKLYFYEAGTSTPLDTYTTQALAVANANPVVADQYGLFGPIYLLDRAYKVVLKTSADVEVFTQDNLRPYTVPALNRVNPSICDGRLTLTSGTPVTTADVTAATTVYWAPYRGNRVALYNSTYGWDLFEFSELSIALGTDATGLPYDVFAYQSAGVVAIERLTWASTSTRATNLTTQNGVLVKSGDATRRYLGTYYTTAIGQTEDSFAKRYVWNYYHRDRRPLRVTEATNTWAYTTDTYRQANGSTANQVGIVVGWAEVPVEVDVHGYVSNSGGGVSCRVSIGDNNATTPASGVIGAFASAATTVTAIHARLRAFPAVGQRAYVWLEKSAVGGTTTWYGDNGDAANLQSGIAGWIEG